MDVREKLVELLSEKCMETCKQRKGYVCSVEECKRSKEKCCGFYADHLISNGVTMQEWISVEDKLPPYNHNVLVYRPNMAMEILVDNYSGYYGEDDDEWHEGWALYGEDAYGNPVITHWAYFPQPPKGE